MGLRAWRQQPLNCRIASTRPVTPPPPSPLCSSIALTAKLANADTDRDGTINQAELHAALRTLTGGVTTEAAAAALIRRLDRCASPLAAASPDYSYSN